MLLRLDSDPSKASDSRKISQLLEETSGHNSTFRTIVLAREMGKAIGFAVQEKAAIQLFIPFIERGIHTVGSNNNDIIVICVNSLQTDGRVFFYCLKLFSCYFKRKQYNICVLSTI